MHVMHELALTCIVFNLTLSRLSLSSTHVRPSTLGYGLGWIELEVNSSVEPQCTACSVTTRAIGIGIGIGVSLRMLCDVVSGD